MSNVLQSTETALSKLHNYVTINMDRGKVAAFTLFELAATLDHNIIIKRLSMWHGISGTALIWFSPYLIYRYQRVKIANCFSAALPISCGVPQGSVLGPLLFILYTTPLNSVIQTHKLDHRLCAGDSHIYFSLVIPDTNCSLNQLRDCLHDIFHWMTDSKIKLNTNKTEFLVIGTQKQHSKLSQNFTPAVSAWNLITFHNHFNFRHHIINLSLLLLSHS